MNKIKSALLIVGLAGFAAALPAAAQSSFYLGGSVGNTEATEDACHIAISTCDRSDTTWSAYGGFMFSPYWGVEAGYRDLGKVVEADDGAGNTAKLKSKAGEAVLVGALPIYRLTLYGKLGAYQAKTDLTSTYLVEGTSKNHQWTYGAGARFDLMRHLAVRVEWQRYNNLGGKEIGLRTDVNVISGGVLVFF